MNGIQEVTGSNPVFSIHKALNVQSFKAFVFYGVRLNDEITTQITITSNGCATPKNLTYQSVFIDDNEPGCL